MKTSFSRLVESRRFWLMLLDAVVSLLLYFVTKYTSIETLDDVKLIIAVLQPVVITVIVAYTVDNAQETKAAAVVDAAQIHMAGFTTSVAGEAKPTYTANASNGA